MGEFPHSAGASSSVQVLLWMLRGASAQGLILSTIWQFPRRFATFAFRRGK